MNLLDSSTLTNQSIAATKLAHTYTASKSCMVTVRVFIDQLSANTGVRQVWLGLLRGGAGSEYCVHMITQSVSVVSTITAIFSYYGPLPIANTDVLKVYVIGVAGDTTTTDIITEIWEENYTLDSVWTDTKAGYVDAAVTSRLAPTIAGRTLDITITGAVLSSGGGSGAVLETVTVTVSGLPQDGVEVWVTTDEAGSNLVANGVTDALGEVDFMLDAGTYYVWKQFAGVNFTNPQTMVVS